MEQWSSNRAPEMCITKETKWLLSCRCHDNSYAAGPVLIRTKIPRFHLTERYDNAGEVRQCGNHVCSEEDPLSNSNRLQTGIFGSSQRETGAKVLAWQQYSTCHFVSFVMNISGAKFDDHCSNISGDILNSVFYRFSGTIYDVITSLICIIQKPEYL